MTDERIETLPDLLRPGLDVVFVGINPGERSARAGHYYAHRGNAFWRMLSASPLVDRELGPEDDERLLDDGIGFTDVVKRVVSDSTRVTDAEVRGARSAFVWRIQGASARAVCFTGAKHFDALYPRVRRSGTWGPQPIRIEGAAVWVMPSTSGRAAAYREDGARVLRDLAAALGRGERA